MAIVYLSLGSNMGDRVGYLQQATGMLSALTDTHIVTTSSFYETEPWQMNSDNWFVNAVIEISTPLSPEDLMKECKKIESILGRTEGNPVGSYKSRTIDIDILFYDNLIINTGDIIIPHRFLQRRAFVLVPMLEIAQDFIHPLYNKTISQLYEELENPEQVFLYGTRV